MIRRVIEQRNKKNALDNGWLSKTDLTIVAVSILFVILLAMINLILFAVRRFVEMRKKRRRFEVNCETLFRHRHRLQGRHLLSTSFTSTMENRKRDGGDHPNRSSFGDSTNSLVNLTNTNHSDILPAVGMTEEEKNERFFAI